MCKIISKGEYLFNFRKSCQCLLHKQLVSRRFKIFAACLLLGTNDLAYPGSIADLSLALYIPVKYQNCEGLSKVVSMEKVRF